MDSTNVLLCWCKDLYLSEKSEMHQIYKILPMFKIWSAQSETGLEQRNQNLICTCFSILSHQAFVYITPLVLQTYISDVIGNKGVFLMDSSTGHSWRTK